MSRDTDQKIDALDAKFDALNEKIDTKFDAITNDVRHLGVMIEVLAGRHDALVEVVLTMQKTMATKQELAEVKTDIKIIRAAVTDTNHQVQNHETRIIRLEARTAR